MKTVIYGLFTLFIFCGLFLGATNMKNPLPLQIAGFAVIALFVWGYDRRKRKANEKKYREQMFLFHNRSNKQSRY